MEVIEMQNAIMKITNLIRGHNSSLDRDQQFTGELKHSSKSFILKDSKIKKIKNKEIYIRKAIKMSNLYYQRTQGKERENQAKQCLKRK